MTHPKWTGPRWNLPKWRPTGDYLDRDGQRCATYSPRADFFDLLDAAAEMRGRAVFWRERWKTRQEGGAAWRRSLGLARGAIETARRIRLGDRARRYLP